MLVIQIIFKKWTFPGTKCTRNYKDACKTVMGTMGDDLIDTMWQFRIRKMAIGMVVPNKVCQNCSNVILAKTGQKANRVVVVQEGLISGSYGTKHVACGK